MAGEVIQVVDDDPDILQFVRMSLEMEGYDVETASNGSEALTASRLRVPDLVLLDVMMPDMDGLAVLGCLRSQPATMNVPVLLLTAKALTRDRVEGLNLGADDYITKPFDPEELIARVGTVLRRSREMREVSPLTGLPGNFRIAAELHRRIEEGRQLAVIHADLDNFKAFNDHYGFMRGDSVIKFTSHALSEAAAAADREAFVGHVGGDDFVIISHPDKVEAVCRQAMDIFDDGILDFYDAEDALAGHVEVPDRRGQVITYPIATISMGVATSKVRNFT
ncbi:MAG: response regulator, partial [Acidimicrobiia bacterium]